MTDRALFFKAAFLLSLFLFAPLRLPAETRRLNPRVLLEIEENGDRLLTLLTVPANAEIYFNREFLARKQAAVRPFDPGVFTAEFRLEGYRTETIELNLEEGYSYRLEAILEPLQTLLRLPPLPRGTELLIDGVPRFASQSEGEEEAAAYPLTAGRRRIELRRFGFKPLVWEGVLPPGEFALPAPEWIPIGPESPAPERSSAANSRAFLPDETGDPHGRSLLAGTGGAALAPQARTLSRGGFEVEELVLFSRPQTTAASGMSSGPGLALAGTFRAAPLPGLEAAFLAAYEIAGSGSSGLQAAGYGQGTLGVKYLLFHPSTDAAGFWPRLAAALTGRYHSGGRPTVYSSAGGSGGFSLSLVFPLEWEIPLGRPGSGTQVLLLLGPGAELLPANGNFWLITRGGLILSGQNYSAGFSAAYKSPALTGPQTSALLSAALEADLIFPGQPLSLGALGIVSLPLDTRPGGRRPGFTAGVSLKWVQSNGRL
jgi:hypothetical protein